jgi:heptosyltransferase-2/heptosyltransferase-3
MIGALEPRSDARRALLAIIGRALAPPRLTAGERRRILVVRPDHLGDLLFLTPALRRLRTSLPYAEIVGLVGPWGLDVLRNNPNLDRLFAWNFPWFDRRPRRSLLAPYWSLAKLAWILRQQRFDVALQFRADFWWGALAVRLASLPEQLGFDAPIVRRFVTQAVPLQHGRHAVEENLALASALAGSGPGPDEPLEFVVTPASRRRAAELLAAAYANRPIVALQVGAGAPIKRWPLDRLARVGRALRDECEGSIVVLGGPSEIEVVQAVVSGVGRAAIGLAGKTSIGELAAVLERCALVIGPDSGPLHLAVAVGTPTVHLFGPADPRRFGPFGDPRWHVVVRSSRACAPCHRLAFPADQLADHACVADISVDEVVPVACALLERSLDRSKATEAR